MIPLILSGVRSSRQPGKQEWWKMVVSDSGHLKNLTFYLHTSYLLNPQFIPKWAFNNVVIVEWLWTKRRTVASIVHSCQEICWLGETMEVMNQAWLEPQGCFTASPGGLHSVSPSCQFHAWTMILYIGAKISRRRPVISWCMRKKECAAHAKTSPLHAANQMRDHDWTLATTL